MAHIFHGNIRTKYGVKIGFWNMNKGMLDKDAESTAKLAELDSFVTNNGIHLMGVFETGLHGRRSRVHRKTPATNLTLKTELNLVGYDMLLPDTWIKHDNAQQLSMQVKS